MKQIKPILAILFCTSSLHAMDAFSALSAIESCNCDYAVGSCGEISRFQILKAVWRTETTLPYSAARNPFTAQNVAIDLMNKRVKQFVLSNNRQPTASEWALLFHCPSCVLHPSAKQRDYANRFVNLLNEK